MFDTLGDIVGLVATGGVSGLFGAAVRLLPALFGGIGKMITAKGDRDHEYRMLALQGQLAKDQGEQRLREMDTVGSWDSMKTQMEAWKEAIKGQSQLTGIGWVDAASAFVRPGVTYYFTLMYGASKLSLAIWPELAPIWKALWTPEDSQMFFGILGFWFVDRQLGKPASK